MNIIFYNSWSGKLPKVVTSDSLSSMIGGLLADKNSGEQLVHTAKRFVHLVFL